ncbi:MAG: hypothetical protein ACPG4Q_05655, partial [Phycisphaeraceae bacterium]
HVSSASEQPTSAVPDALKGFRGMMIGELVEKGENEFVFRVQKIKRVWKKNKAENPEQAIGKTVTLSLANLIKHHEEKIRKNYAGLKSGDMIEVEAFDEGGNKLFVKEALKKIEKA